jgi:hypothetical protein
LQQLKSTLRQTESVDESTKDLPSGHQINQFSSGVFNLIGTIESGQNEKETVDIGVSTEMALGIQFDLLPKEVNANTDQLL